MIIQPRNTGGSGRTGALTVEELLSVAKAQGGEVGRTADRLMSPKKSFLSTLSSGALETLAKFGDALQTPEEVLVGLISSKYTVSEAISQNITPGKALLGDAPAASASLFNRAAYQIGKFGLDTILDPLTYLSFGTSKGLLGITKGAEIVAGAKTAAKLGVKEGATLNLTKRGDELRNAYVASQTNGLRQTFLKNESVKMINKGATKEEAATAVAKLDKSTSDSLIAATLDSPLDKAAASKVVSRLIESQPHLINTLIDKGGVKFAGMSILEAQRFRSVMDLIPGMTMVDRALESTRGVIGNIFSSRYTNGVRASDEEYNLSRKWDMLQQSMKDKLIVDGMKVKRKLKLTNDEWSFVTAAVEHGLKPADPKAADVWTLVHGVTPENGTIPENVWRGVIAVDKMKSDSLKLYRSAGIPVKSNINYSPHYLVTEKINHKAFSFSTAAPKATRLKFASNSVFVEENGTRIPVKILDKPDANGDVNILKYKDGELVKDKVKFVDSSKELKKIDNLYEKNSKELNKALEKVKADINKGGIAIKKNIAVKAIDKIKRAINDVSGIDAEEKAILNDKMVAMLGSEDIVGLIDKRLRAKYKKGLKVSTGSSMSTDDIYKFSTELVMAEPQAKFTVGQVNKVLGKVISKETKKKMSKAEYKKASDEVASVVKEIKSEIKASKTKVIDRRIDSNKVKVFLKEIITSLSDNPSGISRILDSIIENRQLSSDIKAEMSDIASAYKIEKKQITDAAGKYVTASGDILKRDRIRIDEAKKLGVTFEENALVTAIKSSQEAINVTVAKGMMKDFAEKFGKRESVAPEAFVPIDKVGLQHEGTDLATFLKSSDGERLLFDPIIAKKITDFTEGMKSHDSGLETALNAFDSIQNYFKAAVTSIWPAFHGRNALSNVFLMYNKIGLESLNPSNHVAASNMLMMEAKGSKIQSDIIKGTAKAEDYTKHINKTVFTDNSGYKWSWGEMRTQIMDNVVAFHHNNLGKTDQITAGVTDINKLRRRISPDSKFEKAVDKYGKFNPLSTRNYLYEGGFKIGQTIEDYSRTLTFLAELKAKGDPMQAARTVKMALFDYSDLSHFEKTVMRRIIPFYSFSRKNIELQVRTLLTNPGRISQQIRAVRSIGDAFGGSKLTEAEQKALPEWARQGYNQVIGREGSHVQLLRTLGTPLEAVFNLGDPNANLGTLSPLITKPVEMATDYSFFYGKSISSITNADGYKNAPQSIKDFIGYAEVTYKNSKDNKEYTLNTSFNPKNMYIINNLQPVGRFFNQVKNIDKTGGGVKGLSALFFGIGTSEFDLEKEAQRRINENKQALEDILSQAKIGYKFTKFNFSTNQPTITP